MYILVINAGSSSLKYQLFNIETKAVLAKGLAERIGISGGRIKHQFTKNGNSGERLIEQALPGHSEAFEIVSALLTDKEIGVIEKPEDITAVGHRVVHGGEKFVQTQVITQAVKDAIQSLIPLAPLHNPPNLVGIEAAEKVFPRPLKWQCLIPLFTTPFPKGLSAMPYLKNFIPKTASGCTAFMAPAINTCTMKLKNI